jgi:hypothetical protein
MHKIFIRPLLFSRAWCEIHVLTHVFAKIQTGEKEQKKTKNQQHRIEIQIKTNYQKANKREQCHAAKAL